MKLYRVEFSGFMIVEAEDETDAEMAVDRNIDIYTDESPEYDTSYDQYELQIENVSEITKEDLLK